MDFTKHFDSKNAYDIIDCCATTDHGIKKQLTINDVKLDARERNGSFTSLTSYFEMKEKQDENKMTRKRAFAESDPLYKLIGSSRVKSNGGNAHRTNTFNQRPGPEKGAPLPGLLPVAEIRAQRLKSLRDDTHFTNRILKSQRGKQGLNLAFYTCIDKKPGEDMDPSVLVMDCKSRKRLASYDEERWRRNSA